MIICKYTCKRVHLYVVYTRNVTSYAFRRQNILLNCANGWWLEEEPRIVDPNTRTATGAIVLKNSQYFFFLTLGGQWLLAGPLEKTMADGSSIRIRH